MKILMESVGFTADKKLKEFIEKKVNKLDQFYDRIISAEVYLKLENSGQVREKVAELRLDLPGETLVSKGTHKTFEGAIDKGVDAAKRQVIRHKERRRGH